MSDTVTLPLEDSAHGSTDGKKRRMSRLGMSGFRDVLRMLKRSHSEQHHSPPSPLPSQPVPASTTSLNTESFMGSHSQHHYTHGTHGQLPQKGSKASAGPDSLWSGRNQSNSPYAPPSPVNHNASPRHPSLASIFRIGQKNKDTSTASTGESSQDSYSENRSTSLGNNMSVEVEIFAPTQMVIEVLKEELNFEVAQKKPITTSRIKTAKYSS